MKKKILALCLVVVLAITAVTGATLAYFTDSDKATNTFVVGNLDIEMHEQNREGNVFEQNQNLKPAVDSKVQKKTAITFNGYNFEIRSLEGNYVDKLVSVENKGTEPAYIRTIIAIPSMNGFDDDADATHNPLHWNYLDCTDFVGGWDWDGDKDTVSIAQKEYVKEVDIGGVEYDIYVATHRNPVASKTMTSPSMVGFYLDNDIDYDSVDGYTQTVKVGNDTIIRDLNEWMSAGDGGKVTLNILVATQACQTDGFADAWEALDTAFGAIDAAAAKALFE